MTPTISLIREDARFLNDGLGHASPLLPASGECGVYATNVLLRFWRLKLSRNNVLGVERSFVNMQDIRWKQRFKNFDRAFVLLREVWERGMDSLTQLEKEGAIQRFEFAFELAWKTLKDYLEEQGVVFKEATPRKVIKEAFAVGILEDGQVWMDILHHRNLLTHKYDFKTFDEALTKIEVCYYAAFDQLHEFFLLRSVDSE